MRKVRTGAEVLLSEGKIKALMQHAVYTGVDFDVREMMQRPDGELDEGFLPPGWREKIIP